MQFGRYADSTSEGRQRGETSNDSQLGLRHPPPTKRELVHCGIDIRDVGGPDFIGFCVCPETYPF